MTTPTTSAMHEEHRQWTSEAALWHNELAIWQKELADMQHALQLAVEHHAQKLRQHGGVVRMDELEVGQHEHVMAEAAQAHGQTPAPAADEQHELQGQRHAQARRVHEQLKNHHHAVVSEAKKLVSRLNGD